MQRLRKLTKGLKTSYRDGDVAGRVQRFNGWTDRSADSAGSVGSAADTNTYDHSETAREYYDLCNEFMVFGWGDSLHFAPLSPKETLEESKVRHQQLMISKLELREGMRVLDIGCGIGGPMRRVASEADVAVVGVNISKVQLDKARTLNTEAGLDHLVDCIESSFMDLNTIPDSSFDRAYAIESTCHAPDKQGAFAEIFRVLKPGALLWGQEMCMTDKYDPEDDRHRAIKSDLMHGIALRDIATTGEVSRALEAVGFDVVEGTDMGVTTNTSPTPWYKPMETTAGTRGYSQHRTPKGRKVLAKASGLAELLRVIPKGSGDVVRLMDETADAYVAGGKTGIFSPLYCFLARKPSP